MTPIQETNLKALTPQQINAIIKRIFRRFATGTIQGGADYSRYLYQLQIAESTCLSDRTVYQWCAVVRHLAYPGHAAELADYTAEDYARETRGLLDMDVKTRALALIFVEGYHDFSVVMGYPMNNTKPLTLEA